MQVKRYKLLFTFCLIIISTLIFHIGCQFKSQENPIGANNTNPVQLATAGVANVKFILGPSPSLRMQTIAKATPTVTLSLKLVNIGDSLNPIIFLRKKATLTKTSNGFTAITEFNSIPALPVIGRLVITGGYIASGTTRINTWTGATDQVSGQTKSVVMMPEGDKSATDVIVNVAEKLLENPANIATMPVSLMSSIASYVANLNFTLDATTLYNNALTNFTIAETPSEAIVLDKSVSSLVLQDIQIHLVNLGISADTSTTVDANGTKALVKAVYLSKTAGHLVLIPSSTANDVINIFSSLTFKPALPNGTELEIRKPDGTVLAKAFTGNVGKTPVDSIALSSSTYSINIRYSQVISVDILPANATDKSVTWSSSNPLIASVDSSGKVTAISSGTSTITVKTNDGSKIATCVITVTTVAPTSVVLNKSTAALNVNNSETLIATILPEETTNKSVTWSSSDPSIASVNSSGMVMGVSAGTATITAATTDGNKTASCIFTISTVPVESIVIDKTNTQISVGNFEILTATIHPSDATDKSITWSSNNPTIASVDSNGKVSAKSAGTINILATTNDGNKTASCIVLVNTSGTDFTSIHSAPGTSLLSTPGTMYSHQTNINNMAVNVPANTSENYFALAICNTDSISQCITIKPESYVLKNNILPSLKISKQLSSDPLWSKLLESQAKIDKIMRKQAENNLKKSATSGLRQTIRASDHSSEKEGDIVPLKIIGDSWGTSYLTRNCKLVRLGTHCKIFVDQDSFNGLDAPTNMTETDYDHFEQQYDDIIWPLLTNDYSPVYDIDNDNRVSVVFSPVYSKLGFAGLFNSNNFETNSNSNERDLIAIFSPDPLGGWSGNRWLEAARETLCHETQHLVNYSAHFYFAPITNTMEAEWLDEALSVSVEARYRIIRGDRQSENRFDLWASNPSSVGLTSFNRALQQYGMVGLFGFYLYEQGGASSIKKLLETSGELGVDNINKVFASHGGMNTLFKQWSMAAIMEGAKKQSIVDITKVDSKYKYNAAFNLDVNYTSLSYGDSSSAINVAPYGVALYVIKQPAGFSASEYQFRVESTTGRNIEIVMMKLPK